MKLSVRVRGDWFAVPCKGTEKISWLGEEAVRRYLKIKSTKKEVDGTEYQVVEIRKTRGGAILHHDDVINEILDDNDFVSLVLQRDVPNTDKAVIDAVTYVPDHIPGIFKTTKEEMVLDGSSLTCEDLLRLGCGDIKIKLSAEAVANINKARKPLEKIISEHKAVYGVTTGFGKFATTAISKENLQALQQNLIRSHAAGVGNPLTPERTRRLMALRINVLAKGHSGVRLKTVQQYIDAFNANCLSWIPEKGSVGASGDLAPLAHLALGLMGEGKMWCPESGWGDAKYILESHNLEPIILGPKEGISLINGTQFISALGVEAVERGDNIAKQADVAAALSLEVLKGTTKAFDSDVHKVRPHKGQIAVARRFRALLNSDIYPSEIAVSHRFCNRVQDSYTLRCIPQVHGISNDTIDFVRSLLTVEINSATDNPLIFPDREVIISAGNFHGEYPAKALDYLAIVHELANMSERRTERLINPANSELPAFLTPEGGLNSGLMVAHCTAAALVSENKVLCHPSSVDSLTTSAGMEDHVSMGAYAARKALEVVENVERVIAVELLAGCQAIEFLRPLKTTAPLEAVYKLVRTVVSPWDRDRVVCVDMDALTKLLKEGAIWNCVKPFIIDYEEKQTGIEFDIPSPTSTYTNKMAPKMANNKKRKRQNSD